MTIGIMQPYLLPYLGYFQMINACDEFVIYDNIQFTKKGWIHRNRILLNGKDHMFSLPLKNDSDYLDIRERTISDEYDKEKIKILGQIKSAYARAPYFKTVYPVIEEIFLYPDRNLFGFIFHSIVRLNTWLCINTPVVVSSTIPANHGLKGKYRVMELVKQRGAERYINPIGGMELYDKQEFADNGIKLQFHKIHPISYPQGSNNFVPYLSILDVMMFNSSEIIAGYLGAFDLL